MVEEKTVLYAGIIILMITTISFGVLWMREISYEPDRVLTGKFHYDGQADLLAGYGIEPVIFYVTYCSIGNTSLMISTESYNSHKIPEGAYVVVFLDGDTGLKRCWSIHSYEEVK